MSEGQKDGPTDFTPVGLERDIRLEIMLQLLKQNRPSTRIEAEADKLTRFVIDGPKIDPNLVKKIEVTLMSGEPTEANAYLFDDNTMQIEFPDPEALKSLFEFMDVQGISFYGIPAVPVETTKDN